VVIGTNLLVGNWKGKRYVIIRSRIIFVYVVCGINFRVLFSRQILCQERFWRYTIGDRIVVIFLSLLPIGLFVFLIIYGVYWLGKLDKPAKW